MADRQSAKATAREKAVSPGVAYEVAAERGAELAGAALSKEQAGKAGAATHYGLGAGWAVVYPLLRHTVGGHPLLAALATGLSLELLVDQGANAAYGFSAPPQRYPTSTHIRGFAGHVVYGLVVATAMELAWTVVRRRGQAPSMLSRRT
ncbi:MAG: DUF1440 domain-containing protein [Candidatus Limnocylindria bacterium]